MADEGKFEVEWVPIHPDEVYAHMAGAVDAAIVKLQEFQKRPVRGLILAVLYANEDGSMFMDATTAGEPHELKLAILNLDDFDD